MSRKQPQTILDHRMSQVELPKTYSMSCAQKTTTEDLLSYKSFMNYPLPGPKNPSSASPWTSNTAYLQYAGNAFNQHFITERSSGICQRNKVEGSDATNNNFSLQQHPPVRGYPLSPTQHCPSLAVPKPVYRTPGSYLEAGYNGHSMPSFCVQTGFQQVRPPAVEMNSCTPFAYTPPTVHQPGTKIRQHLSEPRSNSLSFSQGLAGQNSSHRPRDYTCSTTRLPCSQGEMFKSHYNCFTNQNVQMPYDQGFASGNLQGSPAFIPLQQYQTYKSSSIHSKLEQIYSISHHPLSRDVYAHRLPPFACGADTGVPPHNAEEIAAYSDKARMNTVNINLERQVNVCPKVPEQQIRKENDQCKNVDRNLHLDTGRLNKDLRSGTSQEGKLPLCSTHPDERVQRDVSSSNQQPVESSQISISARVQRDVSSSKQWPVENSQISISANNQNVNIVPLLPTNIGVIEQDKTFASQVSNSDHSSVSSLHEPAEAKQCLSTAGESEKKSNLKEEERPTMIPIKSTVSNQSQVTNDQISVQQEALLKQVHEISVDENVVAPSSPPMPVINDVFSLAPYRDYLEGTAPHPFPAHKENTDIHKVSSPSESPEVNQQENLEKRPSTTPRCKDFTKTPDFCYSSKSPKDIETNSLSSSIPHANEEVLDLSMKKSLITDFLSQGLKTVCAKVPESSLQKTIGVTQANTESVLPISRTSHLSQGEITPQTTLISCLAKVTTKSTSADSCTLQEIARSTPSSTNVNCTSQQVAGSNPIRTNISCTSQQTKRNVYFRNRPGYTLQEKVEITPETNHISCPSRATVGNIPLQSSSPCVTVSNNHLMTSKCYPSQVTAENTPEIRMNSSPRTTGNCQLITNSNYFSQTTAEDNIQITSVSSLTQMTADNSLLGVSINFPSQATDGTHFLASVSCSSQGIAGSTPSTPRSTPSTPRSTRSSSSTPATPLTENSSVMTSKYNPSQTSLSPHANSHSPCLQMINQMPIVSSTQRPFLPVSQFHILPQAPEHLSASKNYCIDSSLTPQCSDIMKERKRKYTELLPSQTLPAGLENENNAFQSSKSFMFKKYKIMKLASTGGETHGATCNTSPHALPVPVQSPPESVHLLPPSAPESSPTLGEANVSLASDGAPTFKGSRKHFTQLHNRVCTAIMNSVSRSPHGLLQDLQAKNLEKDTSSVKAKTSSRSSDFSQNSHHNIWMDIDGVRLSLQKLLSLLDTFMFTRTCPFPHVIRAGAIFIPIYLVKDVLYPELLGLSIDRVLQSYKVELRPTTLSEEKALRDTELKDCSSRMLKLLALKQLPDVYPSLLHLYWEHCIEKQIDNKLQIGQKKGELCQTDNNLPANSLDNGHLEVAPEQNEASPLILKLQRVQKQSGVHIYKTQKMQPSQGNEAYSLRKKQQVCSKKKPSKKCGIISYRKRRKGSRRGAAKQFPDLVGKRILHLFDDGQQEAWFPGRVLRVHRRTQKLLDTQYEVWYDDEPGIRYFLELLQDYKKGWLRLDS
ncbi:hypothetical protein GDO86_006197 [Hymenochirus boettgeri]|uniref:Uncharacterized protein n=1 Tax=Hymenochirus boettgeri TaxID=247094 RepID=A0A8T2J9F1_9PIPI|nr:hypothetical protein GDO86_006197 [Hymenochirus boettgeri]